MRIASAAVGIGLSACLVFAAIARPGESAPRGADPFRQRLRIIVETDAGGDPDDEQSMVRFLLCANEWDVEGIIANRPAARDGENRNPVRTGLGIVQAMVRAYGECYPRLRRHDPRYPSPERLLRRTVPGYNDTEAGVDLLIRAVDSPDPRPVWFCNWGTDKESGISCLRRALERVRLERGEQGYARFKRRLPLSSEDRFGPEIGMDPPFPIWVDTFRPEIERRRWYHRFSPLTATAGGFDLERDCRTGHGPLGALYPTNTTLPQKEGDTMSFLYLLPTGMNDPDHPEWGSWAGRYGPNPQHPGKPYFWANQADAWPGPGASPAPSRDNTLRRWAAALQNDFRARLEWCVKDPANANHPPRPQLRGGPFRTARPGDTLRLDADGTADPDRDALDYEWFAYPEAGTCRATVEIRNARTPHATLAVPTAATGTVHVILAVTDRGTPPLTRYRRAIVTLRATPNP